MASLTFCAPKTAFEIPFPRPTKSTNMLCEASKWVFFCKYEKGPIYKPSARSFDLVLQSTDSSEKARLQSIWNYWEADTEDEGPDVPEDELHPDHAVV